MELLGSVAWSICEDLEMVVILPWTYSSIVNIFSASRILAARILGIKSPYILVASASHLDWSITPILRSDHGTVPFLIPMQWSHSIFWSQLRSFRMFSAHRRWTDRTMRLKDVVGIRCSSSEEAILMGPVKDFGPMETPSSSRNNFLVVH